MTDEILSTEAQAESFSTALKKYETFTKVMAKGMMTQWVEAVVSRHWTKAYQLSDDQKFVCYYIRARYLANGANATWYRNRHAKNFKSFANSSHDIKHYAEAISPRRGTTHVSPARFKGASADEFEMIMETEKEMQLIRRVQEHFSTIRKSLQGINLLTAQSELLTEMSEQGLITLTEILKSLPDELGDKAPNGELETEEITE